MNQSETKMNAIRFWKEKRVLITGHTGFKGAWLSRILLDYGAEVVGYALPAAEKNCVFNAAKLENEMQSYIADIRNRGELASCIKTVKPEIVIHLAAQPLVRESYLSPVYTYETNILGTVNLLDVLRECSSVRSIVNVTTDKVYKNFEGEKGYSEDDELCGQDPYSNSKSCSELVTFSYRRYFF